MIKVLYDIGDKKYDFDIVKLTKNIAKTLFEIEKLDYDFSFNLSFVSKAKIKTFNNEERGIDKVTDVLSFPNIDFKKPCDFKPFISKTDIDVSIIDLSNKTIFLGDVLICNDIMEKQAKTYGHTTKREFSFLLTHSLLHLLGYDHIKKSDEIKMFEKQDLVLETLKIKR